MRKATLSAVALIFALSALALPWVALAVTYYAVTGIAKNASGTALVSPSILVTITTTGATATIYSDGAGSSQVNPFTAGSDGSYSFFVTSGRYTITATKSGASYATFITRPVPGASSGTTATDVTCSDCVGLGSETTGPYAASSTEAGVATSALTSPVLTTPRAIYGNNFDGSAALTQAIGSTYGGLGADNSAATGIPVFAAGTATVTTATGTGAPVRATTPTLVTPILGVATATSLSSSGRWRLAADRYGSCGYDRGEPSGQGSIPHCERGSGKYDTNGAANGGTVTVTAGAGARRSTGNGDGGNIKLVGGAAVGSGVAGGVCIQDCTYTTNAFYSRLFTDGTLSALGLQIQKGDGSGLGDIWVRVARFGQSTSSYEVTLGYTFGVIVKNDGLYGWASSNNPESAVTSMSAPSGGVIAFNTTVKDNAAATIKHAGETIVGSSGALRNCTYSTEQLTLSTGAATTDTTASLAPALSRIESITYRITTTITTATAFTVKVKGGNSFSNIGTATTSQTVLTSGSTQVMVPSAFADQYNNAAAKLTIDTTGTPASGVIRLTVFSCAITAPTS